MLEYRFFIIIIFNYSFPSSLVKTFQIQKADI